jgi:hypothetical protein
MDSVLSGFMRLTMSPEEKILKRKVLLKTQAIKLFRQDKEALKERLSLLKIKARLEGLMEKDFDNGLSKKLDAIEVLLGN